jgi:hypothetical protein
MNLAGNTDRLAKHRFLIALANGASIRIHLKAIFAEHLAYATRRRTRYSHGSIAALANRAANSILFKAMFTVHIAGNLHSGTGNKNIRSISTFTNGASIFIRFHTMFTIHHA